ncbi:hypothetical protein D3C72_418240 [compost metagenome]
MQTCHTRHDWPPARRARGAGRDVINDAGGDDTLVFGSNVAAEDVICKVVGNDLYIGIAEAANPALEAHAAQAREPKTRRCSARSSG